MYKVQCHAVYHSNKMIEYNDWLCTIATKYLDFTQTFHFLTDDFLCKGQHGPVIPMSGSFKQFEKKPFMQKRYPKKEICQQAGKSAWYSNTINQHWGRFPSNQSDLVVHNTTFEVNLGPHGRHGDMTWQHGHLHCTLQFNIDIHHLHSTLVLFKDGVFQRFSTFLQGLSVPVRSLSINFNARHGQ